LGQGTTTTYLKLEDILDPVKLLLVAAPGRALAIGSLEAHLKLVEGVHVMRTGARVVVFPSLRLIRPPELAA
jgi:hypothetical protein